jgi:protoporphyrinogen oxidase
VKKIVQELKPENIRKNTSVTKIKRVSGKVHLFDDKGNEEVFDSVVSCIARVLS